MAGQDQYANLANLEVTESAANTLTFEQLVTGAGIFEKMAMVIHRIEYHPAPSSIQLISDESDDLIIGWTTSNTITGLGKNVAQVIDCIQWSDVGFGTPGSAALFQLPVIHDFTTLPSGGLIYPATELYLGIAGTSLASATFCRSSLFFTYKQLKGEEFWELVEATRALT